MSHLRHCTLAISNANADVLREAVAFVAKTNALEQVESINDYGGRPVKVLTGVQGKITVKGYGVNIDTNGKLQVVGDDFNEEMKLQEFQDAVLQSYAAVATARAMRAQGFRTAIQQQAEQVVVVATG
jgi:hypothetical protein